MKHDDELHEVVAGSFEGAMHFALTDRMIDMIDMITEFRLCGCVTWRQK